jgi:hydrogenase small subunit
MKTEKVSDVHLIWMTTGLSCDGDSVAMTSATQPSLEDIALSALPGMPKVHIHNPVLAYENGEDMMRWWYKAEDGQIDPFVLILEGSVPNEEAIKDTGGFWAAMGTDGPMGQPITTNEWIDRLAPKAAAVVALGTCATYGGIPAMKNNPTGAMGLLDYLGWDWKSKLGVPIVCIPGCPAQPDNTTETLLYLVFQLAGASPPIPLDDAHRPKWLFSRTVHESCDRAAFYEQGEFAKEYGSHKCLVKLGCRGPVVFCNVPRRGWQSGIGGCPNVGGICMACTMPGFPDKFMPFMDEEIGGKMSSAIASLTYGPLLRYFRGITQRDRDKEPSWRKPGPKIKSGYQPAW